MSLLQFQFPESGGFLLVVEYSYGDAEALLGCKSHLSNYPLKAILVSSIDAEIPKVLMSLKCRVMAGKPVKERKKESDARASLCAPSGNRTRHFAWHLSNRIVNNRVCSQRPKDHTAVKEGNI